MSGRFRILEQLLLPWSPRHTISVRRTAQMLDVSVATVTRMIEAGELKGYKVREATSPYRVNYDSVVQYIEKLHERNGLEKRF